MRTYLQLHSHYISRECSGNNFQHDDHDRIFGGRKIYLVCLATWLVSAGILLPDIIGVSQHIISYLKYHHGKGREGFFLD